MTRSEPVRSYAMQRDAERTADNNYEDGIVVGDATPGEFIEWSPTGERKMVTGTGWPKDVLVQAKRGDHLRIYGGWGGEVRGIDINGQMAFYRTEADRERRREQYLRDEEKRKEREYRKNRAKLEATVTSLPEVFQRRIARFRAGRADFDKEFLAYELAACVDAVKIAVALKTPEAIERFQKLGYKAQMAAVPGLSDQHSGNTFSFAVRLGWLFAGRPEDVEFEHGAMVPLVGCVDYGCTHELAPTTPKGNSPQ